VFPELEEDWGRRDFLLRVDGVRLLMGGLGFLSTDEYDGVDWKKDYLLRMARFSSDLLGAIDGKCWVCWRLLIRVASRVGGMV